MIKQILKANKEKVAKMKLPIVLGVDSNNKPKIIDLAKVGNILVGGATAQGKTNLLHAFAKSIYYAPKKVFEGCFVIYIDPKGMDCSRPYFDPYLTTMEEICEALEMLCDNIKILMSNPNLSFPPKMVLIDNFDHLVLMDKSIIEKIVFISQRGPRVGIYTVLATARAEYDILPARLRVEMLARVAFRVATTLESRVIIDSPEATLLTNKGEILFSLNLKLTKLQTINVEDDNGE